MRPWPACWRPGTRRVGILDLARGFKKGDVIEASASLITALGSAARCRHRICRSFPDPRSAWRAGRRQQLNRLIPHPYHLTRHRLPVANVTIRNSQPGGLVVWPVGLAELWHSNNI